MRAELGFWASTDFEIMIQQAKASPKRQPMTLKLRLNMEPPEIFVIRIECKFISKRMIWNYML